MSGSKQTNFRSRQDSIDRKLSRIEGVLKDETSHRKTSMNQVLNFAINLADKYLDHVENETKDINHEIQKYQDKKLELDKELSEATEF